MSFWACCLSLLLNFVIQRSIDAVGIGIELPQNIVNDGYRVRLVISVARSVDLREGAIICRRVKPSRATLCFPSFSNEVQYLDLQAGKHVLEVWAENSGSRAVLSYSSKELQVLGRSRPRNEVIATYQSGIQIQQMILQQLIAWNIHDLLVGRSLRELGEWEGAGVELFSEFLRPGDTVYDLGAYMGTFTIAFAAMVYPNGRVFAFEPQKYLAELVHHSISINNYWNVVTVYNMAVGGRSGTVHMPTLDYGVDGTWADMQFQNGQGNNHINTLKWSENTPYVNVSKTSLDEMKDLRSAPCPRLMKLDVEGMELEVLAGAKKLLSRCNPGPALYIENNHPRSNDSKLLMGALTKELGYTCFWHLAPYYRIYNYYGQNDQQTTSLLNLRRVLSYNVFCVHYTMAADNLIQQITTPLQPFHSVETDSLCPVYDSGFHSAKRHDATSTSTETPHPELQWVKQFSVCNEIIPNATPEV